MAEKPVETKDPIVHGSLNWHITAASILLGLSLVWMFVDETVIKRPWKGYQKEFVNRYASFLDRKLTERRAIEQDISQDPTIKEILAKIDAAEKAAADDIAAIDQRLQSVVNPRVTKLTKAMQEIRSEVMALTYVLQHEEGDARKKTEQELEDVKNRKVLVRAVPALNGDNGAVEDLTVDYYSLTAALDNAKSVKAELLQKRSKADEPRRDLVAEYENYAARLREGLSPAQISGLIQKTENFEVGIRQIHIEEYGLVDRCETCHLGIREPIQIGPEDLGGENSRLYVSHPKEELLKIHNPEQLGCTPCHNGNGAATISAKEGHGLIKHWLYPLYDRENTEAGCLQCHEGDLYLEHATTLNEGKELFRFRGCWGCHPREGFDVERAEVRQTGLAAKAVQDTIEQVKWEYEKQEQIADDPNATETDYQAALARLPELTLRLSTLESELIELRRKETALSNQAKNVGPSLRPIKSKLKPEWITKWIKNPHEFRPTTRMPAFRLTDEQVSAIAAAVWQAADPVDGVEHSRGDAAKGKDLFESRGCQACHAAEKGPDGEWSGHIWGPELSRVAEKADYDYIVEWIHDTPDWSLMPNLRLTVEESRDVAAYLFSLSDENANSGEAMAFLDDAQLAEHGGMLIRHFGCAGCHEIAGFEDAGKIGTDLTVEGSKPMDRLDFGLYTQAAKRHWRDDLEYNHKSFFIKKLTDPAFFDHGKVFESELEQARMPDFGLTEQETNALVTYMLGSVESGIPDTMYYNPEDPKKKAIRDGWWVIKKYNCQACHQILPSDKPAIQELPQYRGENVVLAPPSLVGVGARLNPEWLARFLRNPAMSDTNVNRNGLRSYLAIRMPTFNLWDEEIGALVAFFEAMADQTSPYFPPHYEEMSEQELHLARGAFLDADCLNCHASAEASEFDASVIAPNFTQSRFRLKPQWMERWLWDPAKLMPGTKMPAGLFARDDENDRYIVAGQMSDELKEYAGDHLKLFVRYMSLIDEKEAKVLAEIRDARRPPQTQQAEEEFLEEEEEFFEEDE